MTLAWPHQSAAAPTPVDSAKEGADLERSREQLAALERDREARRDSVSLESLAEIDRNLSLGRLAVERGVLRVGEARRREAEAAIAAKESARCDRYRALKAEREAFVVEYSRDYKKALAVLKPLFARQHALNARLAAVDDDIPAGALDCAALLGPIFSSPAIGIGERVIDPWFFFMRLVSV